MYLNTNQYPIDEDIMPRWARPRRRDMAYRFDEDSAYLAPEEMAGSVLRPRSAAPLSRQEALADPTVPVPTLAERYMSTAQPEQPVDPNTEPAAPVLRPRHIEGMPNVSALPSTPGMRRDARIEEIQANPDERPTKWWQRALHGGLEGLQSLNQMLQQTRDPRTGQSTLSGAQAATIVGGTAAAATASPKGVARQLNARELAGLQGQQKQEQERQGAILKQRREAAETDKTIAETEAMRNPESKPVKWEPRKVGRRWVWTNERGERKPMFDEDGKLVIDDDNKFQLHIAPDGTAIKFNPSTGETVDASNYAKPDNTGPKDEKEYGEKTAKLTAAAAAARTRAQNARAQKTALDASNIDPEEKRDRYESLQDEIDKADSDLALAETELKNLPKPMSVTMDEAIKTNKPKRGARTVPRAEIETFRKEILAEKDPVERQERYKQFLEGLKTVNIQ